MRTCRICRFVVELDDVAIMLTGDRCVCLRCFEREVKDTKYLAARVRRDVRDAAEGAQ